jgi:hypothetical protein
MTWFPLVSCPTKSRPEAFLFFSKKDEHSSSFCLELLVILFPEPTTSHPSPCLHRKQPWAQSATLKEVYYGLEASRLAGSIFNDRDPRSISYQRLSGDRDFKVAQGLTTRQRSRSPEVKSEPLKAEDTHQARSHTSKDLLRRIAELCIEKSRRVEARTPKIIVDH